MNDICGWIGVERSAPDSLARMGARSPENVHAGDRRAALWIDTADKLGSFLRTDRYLVAVAGEPRWSTNDLATRALEEGNAGAALEAYRRHGNELFETLRGPFTLAVIDREADEALLAIDRFGIHTLHFALPQDGGLVFGSTAENVRRHPASSNELDPQAIYNYFNAFTIPAPGTIYKQQQKLLPAQYLHYRRGEAKTGYYWQLQYSDVDGAPPARLAERLHELLERAVGRVLGTRDPERIGAFLSGGLDSSTTSGLVGKVTARPPRTFTIGFDAAGYDEMHFARVVTKHFGARAHEHYLSPDEAADAVPRIAAFYDEPFGNSSAVPTYYCAKTARDEGIELLVAGDGGDEIFAGNARYARQTALEKNLRAVRLLPSAVVGPALGLLRGPRLAQRARKHLAFLLLPLPDRMMAGEHLAPGEVTTIFAPDFHSTVDLDAPMALVREEYARTAGGGPLHRMMHLDLRITLADNDLRKVCAMTRMAGVQVRFPFLDEDVVEFAATIPSSILLQGGELRAFYKAAMRDFLPREVIEKKKHGFGMPYDIWLQRHSGMRAIALDAAADFKRRKICTDAYVDGLVERTSVGDIGAASRLWDIMTLELWLAAHGHRAPGA